MRPGLRVGLSSAIGLSLVIISSAALAVCDASPMAKLSSSRFVVEQEGANVCLELHVIASEALARAQSAVKPPRWRISDLTLL